MFGYFITRKLGQAFHPHGKLHSIQQNVWLFHHKKLGQAYALDHFIQQNVWLFHHKNLGHAVATFWDITGEKGRGYKIVSSQENWDMTLPHKIQQNVWLFHHKKSGTCHCHIKFSKMFGYFITRKLGHVCHCNHVKFSKMFGYFITRKLGHAIATLNSSKCLDISSQENWNLPLSH
ncbi:Hypothetical predicted protein [Mytilus galloprovincialis]|uniref:Uncharacterized protein n=1 Tax=Mytilus galloprovincialis TaxID=29158 RepID=A0A8B6CJA2_MYTGA|nr:Hypothetical predicted protein [Mytilus galloprovincialis]